MLQEHIQTRALTAHFIDEYRLFGAVCPDRKTMLMLWDSSNPCKPKDPPGIMFEPGPDYVYSNVDRHTRNHEVNHALPFCESPSMGIAAFVAYAENHITRMMIRRLLIIPVKTLASFARRIGEDTTYVPWQDWLHFATPIEIPQDSTHTHILHSHVLSVREAGAAASTSILRIWDFSLRARRRQVGNDPSALIPPYTVREFPFDADCRDSGFEFTEGGVLATSVRVLVIGRYTEVLTLCTSRVRRAEDASGRFKEYIDFDNRVAGFRLYFHGLNSNHSLRFTCHHLPTRHRHSPNTVLCAPLPTPVPPS